VQKWKEYGFRLIGFWTPMLGEKSNQIVYIWGWESYEERGRKMAPWRARVLGERSAEVLGELGYDAATIRDLAERHCRPAIGRSTSPPPRTASW
jgi:hypothetical protein